MVCAYCGKNEATVHLTVIVDARQSTLDLCAACWESHPKPWLEKTGKTSGKSSGACRQASSDTPPPVVGDLAISEPTSVRQLAELLRVDPCRIIADLMTLGIYAHVNQALDFATITRVARMHGYNATRTP
jgi:hypothetical protein